MLNEIYKELSFSPITADQSDNLVALLSSIGFDGFEILKERLNAYIPGKDLNELELKEVVKFFPDIAFVIKDIEEQNWNAIWEASFEPVIVKDFVAVRASFHPAQPQVKYDIIITPKMSFGTGHHATTALVIVLMEELNFTGKTVIDFGTGTGVLAILADKLDAIKVLAIDNDKWSIENAKENISLNECNVITLLKADSLSDIVPAEIIIANINLNVLKSNMLYFKKLLKASGNIIFSGLLVNDEEAFVKIISQHSFEVKKIVNKDGWIAIWASFTV